VKRKLILSGNCATQPPSPARSGPLATLSSQLRVDKVLRARDKQEKAGDAGNEHGGASEAFKDDEAALGGA